MNVSCTAVTQKFERRRLRSHERKDALLRVTQVDHAPLLPLVIGCQGINERQLQRIKILNFIHLNPPIAWQLVAMRIGKQENILEIHQSVVALIALILVGKLHLLQQSINQLLFTEVAASIAIGVGMLVDVNHHGCRERLILHLTDSFQRMNVVRRKAIGMQTEVARMLILYLKHQMRQLHGPHILAFSPIVCPNLRLIIPRKIAQYAQNVVVINDRCRRRNKPRIEQKTRTETMNIADKQIVGWHLKSLPHAFLHATSGPIGESETEHVAEIHAMSMGLCHAFGQYLRLSATRRGQNKMITSLQCNHGSLETIWSKGVVHACKNSIFK